MLGRRPCAEVLEEFDRLPESERKPGAVSVAGLSPDDVVIPSPPEGGLVLRVHARFLAREHNGELRHATTADFPLMQDKPGVSRAWQLFLQPNTEYMWLTREDRQSLVPSDPEQGDRVEVDAVIAERMARFHLTPQRATTSEGGIVQGKSVRAARLTLVVTDVTPQRIDMRLEGLVRWGSRFDADQATTPNAPLGKGYETRLYGRVHYAPQTHRFTPIDIVAPGDVWGRWGDANGRSMYVERPGRSPFGFAFELADGNSPSDRIPPGGNGRYVERTGYFPAD